MTLSDLPPLPARSFTMIRHGETTANRDGIIAGCLDVGLTDTGRAQAAGLSRYTWPDDVALFASPMRRATETAQIGFPDVPISPHPDLVERNWGCYEGLPLDRLPPRDSHPEQGEDWAAMIRRVHRAICGCLLLAADRPAVIVCHSGVIRATRLLTGQKSVGARAENAVPHAFRWTGTHHKEQIDA